jgi:hypothetical protein
MFKADFKKACDLVDLWMYIRTSAPVLVNGSPLMNFILRRVWDKEILCRRFCFLLQQKVWMLWSWRRCRLHFLQVFLLGETCLLNSVWIDDTKWNKAEWNKMKHSRTERNRVNIMFHSLDILWWNGTILYVSWRSGSY